MTRHGVFGIVAIALLALFATRDLAAQATKEAAAAVKASPDLVAALSSEIGGTPEQAAGAAGTLFGLAKSRLKADEFSKISSAVPGMDALLGAAPLMTGGGGGLGNLTQGLGTAGSSSAITAAASSFSKLGLKPDLVAKAVPVLTSFVTKSGGADVGKLLAGALK